MKHPSIHAQRGLALPVVLIILLVMLVSSIYLIKSSNSTTLTAANLAYDAAQARAVDYGLNQGFEWLGETAKLGQSAFLESAAASGYVAKLLPTASTRSSAFWAGSKVVDVDGQEVEYVIHRLCKDTNSIDNPDNACVVTADNPSKLDGKMKPGESLAVDAPRYISVGKVHFIITARIAGVRGGNVVTQMVVHVGV